MTAYTTIGEISDKLGLTLTAAQQSVAARLADAATAQIERQTGRRYQDTVITAELHTVLGPSLYLNRRPVVSVQALSLRWQYASATPLVLYAPGDFELIDPSNGIVVLRSSYDPIRGGSGFDIVRDDYMGRIDRIASVDYTATPVIPADLRKAATLIAAADLLSTLQPALNGFSAVAVAGALTLTATDETEWRQQADAIIKSYRKLVFA